MDLYLSKHMILRDFWMFLAGRASVNAETAKAVQSLTPYRDNMPSDVRMLLEGIEQSNSKHIAAWLESHGLRLKNGETVTQAIADYILLEHQQTLLKKQATLLEFAGSMPPGQALTRLREMVAKLEEAGVTPQPLEEGKDQNCAKQGTEAQD